ncbi:MAG: archaeal proteasome endopeptidase complex subunit alpha, partial [archaeon]
MQIMSPETMGYDRVATVFSPDGRLFQVQYAMEAVKRGATVIGIVAKNAVVMAADKRITNLLMVPSSIEKIYKIDTHIAIATSGLVADGRKIVDETRVESQRNKIVYGEPIDVVNVVRYVCDMSQLFTQYGGLRPFGVSLLIGGVNGGKPRLFETDPSGTPTEWKATTLGEGRAEIMEILEKEHRDGMSSDEAAGLALRALAKAMKK